MIDHRRRGYQLEFLYRGVNVDALADGGSGGSRRRTR
jgi:hypothetical protein